MNRTEKRVFVHDFAMWSGDFSCMLVIRQVGMNAESSAFLRRALYEVGAKLRVVKNRLVKKALDSRDFPAEFSAFFSGPTGVVFTNEPSKVAKILVEFSKKMEGRFEVLVGMLEGRHLAETEIKALSQLPSLDQLRVQLLGLMISPATRLVQLLREAQTRPLYVLNACCQKK